MKKMKGLCAVVLVAGLGCGWGWQSGTEAFAAAQNPCAEDMARLCADVPSGPEGMIARMECLEAHENELSDACRSFEATMGGRRMERSEELRQKREFRQNCVGDMTAFCQEAAPTSGGMIGCLNDHENELTAPCRQSLQALTK